MYVDFLVDICPLSRLSSQMAYEFYWESTNSMRGKILKSELLFRLQIWITVDSHINGSAYNNKAQQANDASVKYMKHMKQMKHMKHI